MIIILIDLNCTIKTKNKIFHLIGDIKALGRERERERK